MLQPDLQDVDDIHKLFPNAKNVKQSTQPVQSSDRQVICICLYEWTCRGPDYSFAT